MLGDSLHLHDFRASAIVAMVACRWKCTGMALPRRMRWSW